MFLALDETRGMALYPPVRPIRMAPLAQVLRTVAAAFHDLEEVVGISPVGGDPFIPTTVTDTTIHATDRRPTAPIGPVAARRRLDEMLAIHAIRAMNEILIAEIEMRGGSMTLTLA